MEVTRFAASLGATVTGVDVRDLDDDAFATVRAAFAEHHVLAFPDQSLTPEEQKAFGRRWGQLQQHPYNRYGEHPEIITLENRGKAKNPNEHWHRRDWPGSMVRTRMRHPERCIRWRGATRNVVTRRSTSAGRSRSGSTVGAAMRARGYFSSCLSTPPGRTFRPVTAGRLVIWSCGTTDRWFTTRSTTMATTLAPSTGFRFRVTCRWAVPTKR